MVFTSARPWLIAFHRCRRCAPRAAARMRSLTRAAESLHLTHGAISHQIKSLEADFGVRLVERAARHPLDRRRRALRHPRAVRALRLGRCGSGIDRARQPTATSGQRHAVVRGPLAAATDRQVFARHPEIDLDVRCRTNALADFRREDIDLAIRHGLGDWPGLVSEYVLDDATFPVSSRAWPTDGCRRARRICRATRCCDPKGNPGNRGEAAGLDWPEPTRGPMFNDSSHTMQAAIDGQGIALPEARFSATTSATGCWSACSTSSFRCRENTFWSTRRGLPIRPSSRRSGNGCSTKSPRNGWSRPRRKRGRRRRVSLRPPKANVARGERPAIAGVWIGSPRATPPPSFSIRRRALSGASTLSVLSK